MSNKSRDKRLLVALDMPPLHKTLPGEKYNSKYDEVNKWIAARPGLINYIFDKLSAGGYIVFDPVTRTWQGADYE